MTKLSYPQASHVLGCCPMVNRVAGCQPPAGATPLLRFGLPSLPGVIGMVLAPRSASGKHPFYVVCGCGIGCRACGGCGVGVGLWGCGPLVMLCMRALFAGGGGCAWVGCLRGGSSARPVHWVLGSCRCLWRVLWLSAAFAVARCSALLCCVVYCATLLLNVRAPLVCAVLRCAAPACASVGSVWLGVALPCAFLVCAALCCCAVLPSPMPPPPSGGRHGGGACHKGWASVPAGTSGCTLWFGVSVGNLST